MLSEQTIEVACLSIPSATLHIFEKPDITIKGLFSNINHFADKLGLPRNKIIANQEESENCLKKRPR